MQRKFRLTRSEDFSQVRRSGKSYSHPLIVLVARRSEGAGVHVGVAAGRTVGSAVKRNRAKRVMRAAMQSLVSSVAPGWDLVLIARPGLVGCDMYEVREALLVLLRRAEVTLAA